MIKNKNIRDIILTFNKLWYVLIAVAVLVLVWLIAKEREALLNFDWHFNTFPLLLSIAFHLFTILLQALVWHLIIRHFANNSDFLTDFSVFAVSFVSRRIPGGIWSLGSRMGLYPRIKVSTDLILLISILELILLAIAGIANFFIYLPLYSLFFTDFWRILSIGAILIVAMFWVKPDFIIDIANYFLEKRKMKRIERGFSRRAAFLWTLLYMVTWSTDGLSLFFWFGSLIRNGPNLFDTLGISTISSMASYITQFLPTSFTIKELTMSSLLTNWIPLGVGVILAATYRILMMFIEIVFALITRFFFRNIY
jgi:hypothetical protein